MLAISDFLFIIHILFYSNDGSVYFAYKHNAWIVIFHSYNFFLNKLTLINNNNIKVVDWW